MGKNIILIVLILIAFFYSLVSFAQKGVLRGKITDASTGEELIGATILLEGTNHGASTDLDGNYSLEKVEPGSYSAKCQYISYETLLIKDIQIKAGEVQLLNIKLKSVSIGLAEVVVQAATLRHTETAILGMQQKSATVIDGISQQMISRTGESNAAGALKRVTGISVEGGKYVYVRGLSDRYSKTLLNGAEVPGLDPNRNTVHMDLFPSNIIDNIIVYKTFSPDLPGSFTGGMVDIRTRDFPETFTLNFSSSFGFNPQSSLNSDFLSYEGGKTDWLGMDDGNRDMPINPDEVPYYPANRNRIDEITRLFNKDMDITTNNSFLDHSHSFSVGNQVKFLGRPLGYILGLSYSRSYNHYDDGTEGFYRLSSGAGEVLNMDYQYDDKKSEMDILAGVLLNLSYKISDLNKIGINIIHNQGGEKSARYMYGEVPSDGVGRFRETRTLKFVERALTAAQLRGEHLFKKINDFRIDWHTSITHSIQKEPDLRYFTNSVYPEQPDSARYSINPSEYRVPARYFRNLNQISSDNKISAEMPFSIKGNPAKLKFGGAFSYIYRDFDEARFDYQSQVNYYNGSIADYLSDEYIGQEHPLYDPVTKKNYGLYIQNATDSKNRYEADQTVSAAFIMTEMPLTANLKAIFGARYEQTSIESVSGNDKYEPGTLNESDFLPSINMVYALNERSNLRLGLNSTIGRPTFREISPGESEDFQGGIVYIGNPDLKRTKIYNADLRYENFIRAGEIFSLSGFFKVFDDPIELADDIRAANPQLTWINTDEATVYGAEAEIRKRLDTFYPLRKLSIGANVAWIKSRVTIDNLELELIRTYDPDAAGTREMFGQSPYLVNGFLGYVNDSLGFEVNMTINVAGPKLSVVMRGGTPDVYEDPVPMLNVNLSKKLGKYFALKMSAENILNPEHKFTYNYLDTEYIYRTYKTGPKFEVGISYTII